MEWFPTYPESNNTKVNRRNRGACLYLGSHKHNNISEPQPKRRNRRFVLLKKTGEGVQDIGDEGESFGEVWRFPPIFNKWLPHSSTNRFPFSFIAPSPCFPLMCKKFSLADQTFAFKSPIISTTSRFRNPCKDILQFALETLPFHPQLVHILGRSSGCGACILTWLSLGLPKLLSLPRNCSSFVCWERFRPYQCNDHLPPASPNIKTASRR